jgi:hypothetical protein
MIIIFGGAGLESGSRAHPEKTRTEVPMLIKAVKFRLKKDVVINLLFLVFIIYIPVVWLKFNRFNYLCLYNSSKTLSRNYKFIYKQG